MVFSLLIFYLRGQTCVNGVIFLISPSGSLFSVHGSDGQPFPSRGTHELVTHVCGPLKTCVFLQSDNTKGDDFDSFAPHVHWLLSFTVATLRGERSVPLTEWPGTACFKTSCGVLVENRWFMEVQLSFLKYDFVSCIVTEFIYSHSCVWWRLQGPLYVIPSAGEHS